MSYSYEDLRKRIDELEKKLRDVTREKGEAAREGGGWHDNPGYDILQQEEMMLRERLVSLRELLLKAESEA